MSHYLEVNLPRQFDHYVWFDRTTSVRPLVGKTRPEPVGQNCSRFPEKT